LPKFYARYNNSDICFNILDILAISIFESSDAISLKSSDTIALNLGGGFSKVYKSINIPVIKITSQVYLICVYMKII
jgi:hypothetical protein